MSSWVYVGVAKATSILTDSSKKETACVQQNTSRLQRRWRQNIKKQLHVGVGVCFADMFRGMFRGYVSGMFRGIMSYFTCNFGGMLRVCFGGMFRGMLQGMFRGCATRVPF